MSTILEEAVLEKVDDARSPHDELLEHPYSAHSDDRKTEWNHIDTAELQDIPNGNHGQLSGSSLQRWLADDPPWTLSAQTIPLEHHGKRQSTLQKRNLSERSENNQTPSISTRTASSIYYSAASTKSRHIDSKRTNNYNEKG